MSTPISKANRRLFLGLYFLSGFCALVYEVLWMRLYTRLLGTTTLAVGLVLACFMLGLAWGSHFWGKFIDRRGFPPKIYAFLELGIGAYALLLPLLLKLVGRLYLYIYQSYQPSMSTIQLLYFIFSFLLLLPPTFLMGGSFPVLAKLMVPDAGRLGLRISYLYGANLLGAVAGTISTGFWWINWLGVRGTNWMAVVINLLIALAAYLYGRRISLHPEEETVQDKSTTEEAGRAVSASPCLAYLILIAVALSGLVSLIYEVVWTRIISLIINNTVYAFSIMLGTYLAGLFIGSIFISSAVDKKRDLLHLFGVFEIVLGVYALLHIPLFGKLGYLFFQYKLERGVLANSWFRFAGGQFILCAAIMLLPAIIMGALFPMACKLYHQYRHADGVGQDMGLIYAANTGGAVLGPLLAGLILIPGIGSQRTIVLAALVNLLIGVVVTLTNPLASAKKRVYSLVATMMLVWVGSQTLQSDITFRERAGAEGEWIIYQREDSSSLIEVYEDRERIKTLVSNRQQQEGSNRWLSVYSQKKQGYLPLLLHPDPKYILSIGLGTGISLAPALGFSPELVECVEISGGIIDAARLFADENKNILNQPNVRIIKADGRNYLSLTSQKYDVIMADLFSPSRAGVGSLYTREHYAQCRAKLRPGGIMCQWLPPHQLSPEGLRIIINTFRSVFPHTSLWLTRQSIALIGTLDELKIDYPLFESRFNKGRVSQDLSRLQLNDPLEFLSCFMMGGEGLARFADQAPLNTDNNPLIEFATPKYSFQLSDKTLYRQNLEGLSRYRQRIFPQYIGKLAPQGMESLKRKLEQYYQARSHTILGRIFDLSGNNFRAVNKFQQAWAINPQEPEAKLFLERYYINQAERLLEMDSAEQAQEAYQNAIRVAPESITARLGRASIYYSQSRYEAALEEWRQALRIDPYNMEALGYIELTKRKLPLK